jgi:hypothetical protein
MRAWEIRIQTLSIEMAESSALETMRKALEAQREATMNWEKAFSEQLEHERAKLAEEKAKFDSDQAAWNEATALSEAVLDGMDYIVTLDVGGIEFKTSVATMVSKKLSLFNALLTTKRSVHYFIDRDATYFPHILNILRGAHVPKEILENPGFIDDLKFYKLEASLPKKATPATKVVNIFGELARRFEIESNYRERLVSEGIVDVCISRHGNASVNPSRLIDSSSLLLIESLFRIKGEMAFSVIFKKGIRVCPTKYTFASTTSKKPCNWRLEGSFKGPVPWTILREHKDEDGYPNEPNIYKDGWDVDAKGVFYEVLRIVSTGPVVNDSDGPEYWPLVLGRLEFLGHIKEVAEDAD